MRKYGIRVTALAAGLLSSGCLRAVNQRFSEPHAVDFSSVSAFAELAQAAYEDDAAAEAACRKNGYGEATGRTIAATGNRYFLCTDDAGRRQLISVRGTSNLKNVKQDVEFEKADDPVLNIRLHRGFRKATRRVFDEVVPLLKKDYTVSTTGHSLGGAEAVILGMYLDAQGWKVSQIVTFGQPKVTDKKGARRFARLPLLRVVNMDDPVPLVPPRELRYIVKPYRHLGREVLLLNGPYYSYLENGNESDPTGMAFWDSADNLADFKKDLPQHYMLTYMARLQPKTQTAREVPYADRLAHSTP